MAEVHRLREEIVLRLSETQTLTRIFKKQCDHANKTNVKVYTPDSITFETGNMMKDFVNQVDLNDGINLDLDIRMTFMEFDPLLKAALDFQSTSCVKQLFTDLGLEELRAVLHC